MRQHKIHGLQSRAGLDRTSDFQKFCGSGLDWIQFLQIWFGLGLKSFTVRLSLTLWCPNLGFNSCENIKK